MRRDLRALSIDRRVDIGDLPTGIGEQLPRCPQQFTTIDTTVTRISVRKMTPDIAKPSCAEQRINDCVQQNIGVRMPEKPLLMRDLDPTHNQLPSGNQLMDIIPVSDTDH